MLVRHGYGVLVFDRRAEGESEGDPNALGWAFDRDLKGAIAYLRSRPEVDPSRIGGLGLSVGGEAFLQTAAETKDLKAVVSDGARARSVREDTIHVQLGKVPEVVFSGVMTAGISLFSNQAPPPSLRDISARITSTPVFFIYAEHGLGGEENNPAYHAAAARPEADLESRHDAHAWAHRPSARVRAASGRLLRPDATSLAQAPQNLYTCTLRK
jgi:dienelactone hydrolase